MKLSETIKVLNTLIQINNDRIEGYETAADETDELGLKTFFNKLAHTSRRCNKDLEDQVMKLGGTPTESTKITGKFFRILMDLKAALTNKDRKTILNSCEFGEDAALAVYKRTLKESISMLTNVQYEMIRSQFNLLKTDHEKVILLRDSVLA